MHESATMDSGVVFVAAALLGAVTYAANIGAKDSLLELLMKHGGDPRIKNRDGLTAIQLAKQKGKSRVAQFFESWKKRNSPWANCLLI